MSLNPPEQYSTEGNLRARQRLWEQQQPRFDLVAWVLQLAAPALGDGSRVLDLGCGNGMYLTELRHRHVDAVGCDLSFGMLTAAAPHRPLINTDATALPFADRSFDVVLAPHMLYHVDDRVAAAIEMRRVLGSGGGCIVVTNGRHHMRELRRLVEAAVREVTPGWEMRNPSTHAFSLDNGSEALRAAFDHIDRVRVDGAAPVTITDVSIAADYVASVADHYEHETTRPWREVVDSVRRDVQQEIDETGAFTVHGETGAFICT